MCVFACAFQEPATFRLKICINLEVKSSGMVCIQGCDEDCSRSEMKCAGSRNAFTEMQCWRIVFSVCSRMPVIMAKTNYTVIVYIYMCRVSNTRDKTVF